MLLQDLTFLDKSGESCHKPFRGKKAPQTSLELQRSLNTYIKGNNCHDNNDLLFPESQGDL